MTEPVVPSPSQDAEGDGGEYECIHCGEYDEGTDHWERCASHPAHARIAAIRAPYEELVQASRGLIEQIELEIGACDGTENSRLWPTANETRAALARIEESLGGRS